MVSTFYPPYHFGGDATYIYRLTEQLAARGHRVDVIHDRDAYYLAHPDEPEIEYAHHPGVTVHALKSRVGPLSPLATQQTGYPLFKPQIRRLLEGGDHDVIHFHNTSLIGPAALRYGRGIKLYTMHEHWLVCPMHILWKFDREACTRQQCLQCTVRGHRPPQVWRYTGFLARQLRHVDQFIAPSRFTRDKHRELGLNVPTAVLPYFLPYESPPASDEEVAPPHERPYFLFVGRLIRAKGAQTLLPLFKAYPHADLLIVGDGDYAATLRAQAREIPNVTFLGAQPYKRLRALYRHAIAVIMPSLCYEVFGIVLIEAFAARTPVIVRKLGALPEVVADSNGGFVFDDDRGLLEAMRRLQEDPDLRRRLGDEGHRAYLQLWTEEPHLRKYVEIIEAARERRRRC